MDSAAENKTSAVETARTEIEDGAAVINLLRRFHYGEPAAAESTRRRHPPVQSCPHY